MAIMMKRKRTTRRAIRTKRRATLRRPMSIGRPRIVPAYRQPKLVMKRTNYVGSWTFATTTTNDFWRYMTYTPNNFNNFGEFAGVFDEYRINAIKVTFRPKYDTVTVGQPPQCFAHFFVDPASTVIPSGTYTSGSLNTFLENSGVKTRSTNRPFSIYFKPKVSDQLNGGGTVSRAISPTYLKTTETNVDHRGFHMYLQTNNFNTVGTTNITLDMYVTMYVTFRNLK